MSTRLWRRWLDLSPARSARTKTRLGALLVSKDLPQGLGLLKLGVCWHPTPKGSVGDGLTRMQPLAATALLRYDASVLVHQGMIGKSPAELQTGQECMLEILKKLFRCWIIASYMYTCAPMYTCRFAGRT